MKKIFLMGLIALSLVSCQREIDRYYELPDWLKGNAYEVMEDKGNFSLFMRAVDRSSYADLVRGKGIVTVMAPTDEAFKAYLTKHNYSSVDAIPEIELNKLVGFHLIYYSYSKNNFLFYNPDGADAELINPGSYFKFRTKSRDAITTSIDYANGGSVRKVMHKERFIPIISDLTFSMGTVSAEEYTALFPGSIYTGGIDRFNVANASVVDTEVVTDNGYLYTINQVLEPLETIYTEIAKEGSEYTKFAALYNRFLKYEYDTDATADYGNGDSLFIQSHILLPPIACEWTSALGSSVPDYAQTNSLAGRSYGILAPSNRAIEQFYQKYWAGSFGSLEEINYVPLLHFMQGHTSTYAGSMLSLSTLKNWVNRDDQYDGAVDVPNYIKVCSNGILGGMDNVITPVYFETPIAPALCDKNYNIFSLIAYRGKLIEKFDKGGQTKFYVFFPNNEMLQRSEYNGDFISYQRGNPYIINDEKIQVANSTDGTLGELSRTQGAAIAGAHVADGIVSQKSSTEMIYSTYNDYEYLYQVDGKIYSSAAWNAKALGSDVSVPTLELIRDYGASGVAYALKGDNATMGLLPEQGNFKDHVIQDKAMVDFKGMNLYLTLAPSLKVDPAFNFLQGNRFVVFMPTMQAISANMQGSKPYLPPNASVSDKESYVKGLFVDVSASAMMEYPFVAPGKSSEKVLTTFGWKTVDGKKVNIKLTLINNADGSMKVRDAKGNEANIISYFPYIYADGAAYVIDGVLDLLN